MNHLDVYFLNSVREFGKGGVQMAISDFTLSALSLSQVSPTTIMSFFSCSIGCLNNVLEFPLVLMARSTSPFRPTPSTYLE